MVTLVRLVRRLDRSSTLYLVVLGVIGCATVGAILTGSSFVGVLAIGFATLVVVVPWILEAAARSLFARGKLRWAVWCAGARAMLMLGAGLARQQEILRGLAVLERDGVDGALDHFRRLVGDAEDGGELVLINEQIVSMFFYGQRWDEGIAHYEARFHPRYAALRPALALGLLRAYGESGRMEHAAGLLQALEQGPVGEDPRASGVVSQARLTFLAYAGAAPEVARALAGPGREALGLSAASGALFAGIAHWRAGDGPAAKLELARVESLARSDDERVVLASRRAIEGIDDPAGEPGRVDLSEELSSYAESVAGRLRTFVEAAPRWRPPSVVAGTGGLVLVVLGFYLAFTALEQGGVGLLSLGAATPGLVRAEDWWRIGSGLFVQADPLATLLVLYTVWTAGLVLERCYGTARVLCIALLSGAAGLAVASLVGATSAGAVLSGSTFVAVGLATAALWTVAVRLPGSSKARRRRALPLALLIVAHALSIVPGLLATDVDLFGFAAAVVIGSVGIAWAPTTARRVADAVALVLVAATVAAWVQAWIGDSDARLQAIRDASVVEGPAVFVAPATFEVLPARDAAIGVGLPLQSGVTDTLALRGGWLVQYDFADAPGVDEEPAPALFRIDPSLRHECTASEGELPEGFAAAYASAGGDPTQLRLVRFRRNGNEVALTVERDFGDGTLVLTASPAAALEPAVGLYAAILAEARLR